MADQMTIDMLIDLLDEAELFPGEEGAVYARFNLNGERVTYGRAAVVWRRLR
jgi:hypothetical protein